MKTGGTRLSARGVSSATSSTPAATRSGSPPIPMMLIDAWLEDLRREEEEIAAIVRERSAAGPSTPLSEVAERLGIDLTEL